MRAPSLLTALLVAATAAGAARAQETDPRPPLPADSVIYEVRSLDVSVRYRPVRGKLAGFYRRLHRGAGRYITREQIEDRDPFRLTDLVHLVPGFQTVEFGDGSGRRHARIGRSQVLESLQRCSVQYWLDGTPIPPRTGFELDAVSPRDVAGIEVYRGASETPARFQRQGAMCGVVVIWTRDPSER